MVVGKSDNSGIETFRGFKDKKAAGASDNFLT